MIIDPIALATSGQLGPATGGKYCPEPISMASSGQYTLAIAVPLGRVAQNAGGWNIEDDDNDILDLVTIIISSGVLHADS